LQWEQRESLCRAAILARGSALQRAKPPRERTRQHSAHSVVRPHCIHRLQKEVVEGLEQRRHRRPLALVPLALAQAAAADRRPRRRRRHLQTPSVRTVSGGRNDKSLRKLSGAHLMEQKRKATARRFVLNIVKINEVS